MSTGKARVVNDVDGNFYGIRFNCPGCKLYVGASGGHVLPVDWTPEGKQQSPHVANKQKWSFNGDLSSPTFSPSILSRMPVAGTQGFVCHSFIRDGRIEFLGDCTHALAGQTVELPDLDDEHAGEQSET